MEAEACADAMSKKRNNPGEKLDYSSFAETVR
jgi:hypothetical protein